MSYKNQHFLVETDWLEAHLGEPDLRIIDCRVDMSPEEGGGLRFDPAKSAWAEEHIPGATFVDFNQDSPTEIKNCSSSCRPPATSRRSCRATASAPGLESSSTTPS